MYTHGIRINAKLVKEGSFRINAKLVKEESLQTGTFPPELKPAVVRPHIKQPNLDSEEIKNYNLVSFADESEGLCHHRRFLIIPLHVAHCESLVIGHYNIEIKSQNTIFRVAIL